MFLDVARICDYHKPKVIFCENVKGLTIHNRGNTYKVIKKTFEELGYVVFDKILNSKDFGVPQNRERIYIVAFRKDIAPKKFIFPEATDSSKILWDIREEDAVPAKYYLSTTYMNTLIAHKKRHESKGNGFGYGLHTVPIKPDEITRTISARYHKDGAEILIEQPGQRPRRLTVEEAMQLQGYDPERFLFPVSKTQAYKQIGNSVVWPAIHSCALEVAKVLRERRKAR